jgi:predicted transcriptional regulator
MDCGSPGKHPRTEHGLSDASLDLGQINQWWHDWPDANVGIRTGTPGGIVVLDVDGSEGTESLGTFEAQFGTLPTTRTGRTGKGRHFLFRTPETKVVNRAGVLAPGLDIRGTGGYIVAPPSRHACGIRYSWEDWTVPIATMPDWLLDLTRASDPTPTGERRPLKVAGASTPYGRKAMEEELERLIEAQEGSRNQTLNLVAFRLGMLVAGGELDQAFVEEEAAVIALSRGLPEREVQVTLRSAIEAGMRHPREAPPKQEITRPLVLPDGNPWEGLETSSNAPPDPKIILPLASRNGHRRWTGTELLTTEFREPRWTVSGLLPEGLTILGGRPKRGKSWLSLQLAIAVATGGRFLDQQIEKGCVLYFALEDGERRLNKRLLALECPRSVENIYFEFEMPTFGKGGIEYVLGTIADVEPTLVIIDTLSRALPGTTDQSAVNDMTSILGPLQHESIERQLALVVVDHLNKQQPTKDPTLDLLGSTAKGAVPDTLWGLYRDNADPKGTLAIKGRDTEDEELSLAFRPMPLGWQLVGDTRSLSRTNIQDEYLRAFGALGECTADTIADYLGVTRTTAAEMLRKLYEAGDLRMRKGAVRGGRPPLLYWLSPRARARGGAAQKSDSRLKSIEQRSPSLPEVRGGNPPTTKDADSFPEHLWWSED